MQRWARGVKFKCAFEQTPPEQGGIQILGSAEKFIAESRHDWSCVYPVKSSLVFPVCVLAKVAGWNPQSWNILYSSFNAFVHRLNTRAVSCIRWCCRYQSVTLFQARSLIFLTHPSRAGTFEGGATRPISHGSATSWDRLFEKAIPIFLIPESHICHHLTHLLPLGWCSTVVVKCSIQTDVLSELMDGAVTKKKCLSEKEFTCGALFLARARINQQSHEDPSSVSGGW